MPIHIDPKDTLNLNFSKPGLLTQQQWSQSDLSVDFAAIENIFEPSADNDQGRNIAFRDVGAIDIADQILLPSSVMSHSDSTPTQGYISVVPPSNHDIQEERKSDQLSNVAGHAE